MITHPLEIILLDASCLLNLYATRRLRDNALALPYRLGVAEYVREREALYVWRRGANGNEDTRVPVDLAPLVDEGAIQVVRPERPEEEVTFVEFAAVVDDGAAVTVSLALHRGYSVANDDRKARRILAERAPSVRCFPRLSCSKHGLKERQFLMTNCDKRCWQYSRTPAIFPAHATGFMNGG